jgi:hypothetical protein
LRAKVVGANNEVISRLKRGDIELQDIVPAQEVIPFLKGRKAFLHAGPPVTWERMCNSMKGSAIGMMLLEGWAKDEKEALALLASGTTLFYFV